MSTTQVIIGTTQATNLISGYVHAPMGPDPTGYSNYNYGIMPCSGTFRNLRFNLVNAPGDAKSWTCKVYKNMSATALTTTVTGAATYTNIDSTNSFTAAAGDRISVYQSSSGSPAASPGSWSFEFIPDTDDYTILMSSQSGTATTIGHYMAVGACMNGYALFRNT